MPDLRPLKLLSAIFLSLCCVAPLTARAGGSGLNTLVIINQASSNSCELGSYYCERRQVPAENVLYINWNGGNMSWSSDQFQTNLLNPLLQMVTDRQLSNQLDFVVLSMDIPYLVTYGSTLDSTTAALFYGLKPDGGVDWKGVTNSYAASEAAFHSAKPASAPGYSFLATMLTDNSLAQAKQLIEQGVTSDGTFPQQPVILARSSDPLRNVRYAGFDNAIFNTRVGGQALLIRTNSDSPWGQTNLLGYQTGLQNFSVSPNTFVPGSMADSLSSYGGALFGASGQTTLLEFIHGGAAGSYGTVTEPSPDPQKFPDPQNYFYQSRGFTLAECYYQSLQDPYEGLIVGEPLAAPFAVRGWGSLNPLDTNSVLTGLESMSASFAAADAAHPLQQVDLFIDGKYSQTLTNLDPRPGNVLTITLNGYPMTYTVPTNASLGVIATGLANLLNNPANSNATMVLAIPHGDRIELQSTASNHWASPCYVTDTAATISSPRYYRASYVPGLVPPQLTSSGLDRSGAFRLHVETPDILPYAILASTNLVDWAPIASNPSGGPMDFADAATSLYPRRFYRIAAVVADPRPRVSLSSGRAGITLHVEAASALPCLVEISTNLTDWTGVFTNQAGAPMDYLDSQASNVPCRFYRAVLLSPSPTPAQVTPLNLPATNGALLRVDGAVRPYIVWASNDQVTWVPIFTNLLAGRTQTTVSSSTGSADVLSTFLTASRSAFVDSTADGLQSYSANGIFQVGTWLQLSVTKTNGTSITLAVTNQSSSSTILDLTGQLFSQINAFPDLQGNDGLQAQDLGTGQSGAATFKLVARTPGRDAAAIQGRLSGTPRLVCNPKTQANLIANLSDLQPRNHLYVTAGATSLSVNFSLDTTTLADGFHELAAVAYEGSNVRSQTRVCLPIQVQNSPLSATLTLLDLADQAPVQATYHVQVAANTNNVTLTRLFSTGGVLATATNQAVASFSFAGPTLGAGLHPFYAQVETATGAKYRTATRWVRLVNAN